MSNGAATGKSARDYALFDAELSGRVLNFHLLRRLLKWLGPYKATFGVSALLILLASTLQVLLPIVISLVVIDHVLRGEAPGDTPDLGMVALNDWLSTSLGTAGTMPLAAMPSTSRMVAACSVVLPTGRPGSGTPAPGNACSSWKGTKRQCAPLLSPQTVNGPSPVPTTIPPGSGKYSKQ